MDLLVANYYWESSGGDNQLPVLYRNEGNSNHWLTLRLVGTTSNRDAIGTKVRMTATIDGETVWQLREVRSNTGWIAAQNDIWPHFGLGDATVAEMIRIEWPSRTVQEFTDVAADQMLLVTEPPRLSVDSPDTLSWPAASDGYRLESASMANGPWSVASETVEIDGNRKRVTIQPVGATKFYRLKGQ